ncbi:alpha/beta hydrolase family protein [Lacticaseibacillus yichunensis]|uniref:Alpha/beta fold hydrolase n=1 Tax=Lacticaseibacillus yichunensis TaxID=2486015 RepID=A0ABW4CSL2_9LACO|nr:S9 family peptidase [Lacticaseibacillus yichunensis]
MNVQADDIFKIKTLSQPQGDGQTIFYQENWIDETDNTYYSRLRKLDRATRRQLPFGHDQQHDHAPQLNRSQTTLGFLSQDKDGHTQVFVQATDGGSARQLTHEKEGVGAFLWAADDASIFYQTQTTPAKPDPKRPAVKTVTKAQYKLNGAGVLPEGLTSSLKQQVLTNKTGQTLYTNPDGFGLAAVSPTGDMIALALGRDEKDDKNFGSQVGLFDLATGKVTLLALEAPQSALEALTFSPDGTQLLLFGNEGRLPNVQQNHLWHADLATGELTDTTTDLDLDITGMITGDIQRGLSGRGAAFATSDYYVTTGFDHGRASLYVGGPDEPLHVLLGGDRHITDWVLTPDGHGLIFTCSDPVVPSQLRYFDLITEDETLLADPNTRYENSHALVAPEEFNFDRGEFNIEGWYYAPATASAEKHPAILYVHGGPQVGYGDTFFHEMQFLAGKGYGVICLNPRGGAGYGQAFTAAVIQHYGEDDYQDLMTGVDEALRLDPQIDPTHVYVTGGSYGGFMTNWIVTHTNRFKAAATQRSISDWISFYGTSDIGYYFTPWELQGTWSGDTEDVQTLWDFSPLKYIANVKTPTLVLHGEEDQRCPIGQGEEFYTGLKMHGVDTKFMRFPGSNHELSRSGMPHLRIARLNAIADWFEAHR